MHLWYHSGYKNGNVQRDDNHGHDDDDCDWLLILHSLWQAKYKRKFDFFEMKGWTSQQQEPKSKFSASVTDVVLHSAYIKRQWTFLQWFFLTWTSRKRAYTCTLGHLMCRNGVKCCIWLSQGWKKWTFCKNKAWHWEFGSCLHRLPSCQAEQYNLSIC